MFPHFEWHVFSWLSPHLRSNTKNHHEKSDLSWYLPYISHISMLTKSPARFPMAKQTFIARISSPGLSELVPSQPCPPGSPRCPETDRADGAERRLGDDARDERICPFFGGIYIYMCFSTYVCYMTIYNVLCVCVFVYMYVIWPIMIIYHVL